MSLSFKNVDSERVKQCFRTAYDRFPELQRYSVYLQQLPLRGYTMRAQPVINANFFFRNKREYRVQMSDHLEIAQYIQADELPDDVLVGWFAHELGHIVDYHRRNTLSMLKFILGYIFLPTFRSGSERRADLFALKNGFGKQLMATKLYILEQSPLPDKYKDRIKKYYMSPDELELLLLDKDPERVLF